MTRLYLSEVLILAKSIIKDCDIIFNKVLPFEKRANIVVDYETQYLINTIIVSAGNIKNIFQPNKDRKHNETAVVHDTRINRGKHLESMLEMSAIDHLLNVKVRNGIEHFDERIDKLALKKYKKQINNSLILYNMTISSKEVMQILLTDTYKDLKVYYLKVYVVDEKTAYIDNKSLDLAKLRDEAVYLENIVSEILGSEFPGGEMIVIK